ncbi:hypothetical protein [Nostoc sp.]
MTFRLYGKANTKINPPALRSPVPYVPDHFLNQGSHKTDKW